MKKDNINRFYVGELNISFDMMDPLKPLPVSKENQDKYRIYRKTIRNGAIDLVSNTSFDKYNLHTKKLYKNVFTIFYKLDNGKYLCLQNGIIYDYLGSDYFENIKPLKDLLPKLGYDYPKELSLYEASSLFKKALQHKLYDRTLFIIDKFYTGTIDLLQSSSVTCSSALENSEFRNFNIIDNLLLKELFIGPGYSLIKDNHKYCYGKYNSVFYMFNNGDLYNINNNQLYEGNKVNVMEHFIDIEEPLKDRLDKDNIKYEDTTTISKILKLQKKIIFKS